MTKDEIEKRAAAKAIHNCVRKLVKEFKKFDLKPPRTTPAKKFDLTISQLHEKVRKRKRKRKSRDRT